MIVEDQLDHGIGRTSRIEKLEETDELAAAVAIRPPSRGLSIQTPVAVDDTLSWPVSRNSQAARTGDAA
jgi:hypothetical protein